MRRANHNAVSRTKPQLMPLQNASEMTLLQQLQESKLSLKQSEQIARMGSWEWDAVTNRSRWSENIYSLYEIEDPEMNPSYEYVLSRLHPDDLAVLNNAHARMNRDKVQVDVEMRIMFPGGRIKWLLNRMIPSYEGDQLVALRGINLDITERKLAEESMTRLNEELEKKVIERTNEMRNRDKQYQLLLETMKDGVLYVDNDERIIFANQHFCKMLGYSLEELVGQIATDLFLDEEGKEKMKEIIAKRQSNIKGSYEIQMKMKSGEMIWMQINGSPVINDEGKIIGSVGTHSDISPLMQHVHKMEEIIFALSHEVRQPVSNIMGMAQLLEKGQLSTAEIKKIVDYMCESADILNFFTKRVTLQIAESKHIIARQKGISL